MVRTKAAGRVIGYTRVSTGHQVESGLGLEAQRDAVEKVADQLGVEVAEWFTDEGVSGAADIAKRPGLVAALESLGEGDALVVAKRDRLARDLYLSAWCEKEARRRGARIIAGDTPSNGDGDDPTERLLANIVACFADFEREVIRARTRAALDRKRARGEKLGGYTPFGYTATPGPKPKLRPDAGELAVVDRIVAERSRGASYWSIARALTDEGVPTKGGRGEWHANTVRRLHLRAAAHVEMK